MLRTAGFIMHIFATCFQAITVQSNCYANFALIKGQCEAWEVSFFRVHFQATVIRTCSLCRIKKKNLRLQPIKRRVSLAWKPNWLPYHHVLKLWLTGLTPGQALDKLCHRIRRRFSASGKRWRVRPSSKCHQSLGRNGWSSLRRPFKGLWGLRS